MRQRGRWSGWEAGQRGPESGWRCRLQQAMQPQQQVSKRWKVSVCVECCVRGMRAAAAVSCTEPLSRLLHRSPLPWDRRAVRSLNRCPISASGSAALNGGVFAARMLHSAGASTLLAASLRSRPVQRWSQQNPSQREEDTAPTPNNFDSAAPAAPCLVQSGDLSFAVAATVLPRSIAVLVELPPTRHSANTAARRGLVGDSLCT